MASISGQALPPMYLIRKASAADSQAVFDVRNAAIRSESSGHYADDIIERWTTGTVPSDGFVRFVEDVCHVIEINGEIVATGAIDLMTGQVDAVFVRPQNLRQGLASAMMAFLEQQALDASLDALHLESTLNAEVFYRSIGFISSGRSQYHSPRGFSMDCVVMRKRIRNAA
ncbi:MAG: GNAT family N-acetyltransferase [Rhodocyclaceae bacterium]